MTRINPSIQQLFSYISIALIESMVLPYCLSYYNYRISISAGFFHHFPNYYFYITLYFYAVFFNLIFSGIFFNLTAPVQQTLPLMGKAHNIFAFGIGQYSSSARNQRGSFRNAKSIWIESTPMLADS